MLSQRYTVLQSSLSGAERIFQLLDEKEVEDAEPAADAAALPASTGGGGGEEMALALQEVSFEYKPGVPVLRQVSLSARRGEKIALVGATGAGKTTVASILLRLYQPQAGRALLMGRDVRSYRREELRQLVSVVPQDVFLFAGTVLSNIAMGDS